MIVYSTRIVLLEVDSQFATGLLLSDVPLHIKNMMKVHDDNTIGFKLSLNALSMLQSSEEDLRGKVVDITAHLYTGRMRDGRSTFRTHITSIQKAI